MPPDICFAKMEVGLLQQMGERYPEDTREASQEVVEKNSLNQHSSYIKKRKGGGEGWIFAAPPPTQVISKAFYL